MNFNIIINNPVKMLCGLSVVDYISIVLFQFNRNGSVVLGAEA